MKERVSEIPATTSDSEASTTSTLSPHDISKLESMTREELIGLIRKVFASGMLPSGLKGKDLLESSLMSSEELDEGILLRLQILALTSVEAKDVVSTAKEYFDRKRGRPQQSVDINQKIGIVAIVMEAAKRGKNQLIDLNPLASIKEPYTIDK